MHPGGTRDQGARAARALSAVTFGDGRPLVPDDAHRQGPAAMVAAALRKLPPCGGSADASSITGDPAMRA
jgi:hypothetical protein